MKKLIAILLAFVCLLGIAGCADSAQPEPTVPSALPTELTIPTEAPPETETIPVPEVTQPEPDDEDFVRVTTYIPDILVELRYASDNNFTGQVIYEFSDLWLRYGTVKKLMQVQEELRENGLFLKIWDGFRPPAAQFKLWEIYPDHTYVSNPNIGFSSHSRGNTVDLTLVDAEGRELVMPTGFDDFSKLADRDYSDCSAEAAGNARLLEDTMKKYGFKPYSGEWWHFSDTQSYPVEEVFEPVEPSWYYADCNEFISLRAKSDTSADRIVKILVGEEFQVVGYYGDFALVSYGELFGYVLRSYIQPVN
ncbi:MAG: D-alanyl-D-alanine carboxypeptidase family protein [Oscillospiraceae bacterium]|nr:D-alanyl-D-alanine carboxypeptidase family protein [Oscillospiraceae bacterium]